MTTQNTKLLTFALSLRGARFLAYASEQAPQSRWGQVDWGMTLQTTET